MSHSVSGDREPNQVVIKEEILIPLLEEKLLVDRTTKKVGEIVVRKKVETRMVQVPVRWEKLIVEQIGSPNKQLAEINLGQGKTTGIELQKLLNSDNNVSTVNVEFISPKAARDFLEAIALQKQHGCTKVKIEIIVDSQEKQTAYQEMFDRCSGQKQSR